MKLTKRRHHFVFELLACIFKSKKRYVSINNTLLNTLIEGQFVVLSGRRFQDRTRGGSSISS
jgi:hypothetical protein